MGQSTDGILCFGVDYGEEIETLPWQTPDEEGNPLGFDEWLYRLHDASTQPLWQQYAEWAAAHPEVDSQGRLSEYEAQNPAWNEAYREQHEKQRQVEAACPIEAVRHCSGDYPMLIVAVKGTVTTANRGYPKEALCFVLPETVTAAHAFCEEHGIPWDSPKWLLCSMWW